MYVCAYVCSKYVCINVCLYVQCTYMYVCMNVGMCVQLRSSVCACTYVCMHAHTYVCMYACVCKYVRMHARTQACMYVYNYVHACRYIVCTYVRTYVCTRSGNFHGMPWERKGLCNWYYTTDDLPVTNTPVRYKFWEYRSVAISISVLAAV